MDELTEVRSLDDRIASLRSSSLPAEEVGRQLEDLYRQKIEGPRAPTEVEGIDERIQQIRTNDKLTDQQRGEKLEAAYRAKVSAEKTAEESAPAADQETISCEVQSEFRNALGDKYEPTMKAIGGLIVDALGEGALEKFQDFAKNLEMDAGERISAMHQLASLSAAPIENKMDLGQANGIVDERLRSMWGDRAEQTFGFAQRAAEAFFGDLQRADDFFLDHGFGNNPEKRIEMWVLLSRLGRKLKN